MQKMAKLRKPQQDDNEQGGSPFGAKLKRLRKAAGMSQQQLAVAAGLSVVAVSKMEHGENPNPTKQTLERLGEVLGVTAANLLTVDAPSRED